MQHPAGCYDTIHGTLHNTSLRLIIWTPDLKKHITYLISFLLIFGLTVNDCAIYFQTNSPLYYQVSQLFKREEFRHKYSKSYVYGTQLETERIFNSLISYLKLRAVYSVQIKRIFNIQIERFQQTSSIIAQRVFLNKRILSSNYYPCLYIA